MIIDTGELTFCRALSAGEGFASQNSKTLVIGVGEVQTVESVEVVWPSGARTQARKVPPGSLMEFDEAGGDVEIGPYGRN